MKRANYKSVAPEPFKIVSQLYAYIKNCDFEPMLLNIFWLRVSEVNGCAYCVDLHFLGSLAQQADMRKLNGVVAWRHMPFFDRRERAALAWAETLTLVAQDGAPDAAYTAALEEFSESEGVDLAYAIGLMNLLNRLGIGFDAQVEIGLERDAG